jgi:hypothetical protein
MELPVISAADGNFPKAPTNPTRFQPTEGEILEKPWKYVGYDGYSKFLASDDDFMVFRRFGTLNTRIALVLQDKVSVLEEKLVALDTRYSQKEMDDFHNGTLRDELPDREIVIDDIVVALHKYSKCGTNDDAAFG